jgi:hypothetical protein
MKKIISLLLLLNMFSVNSVIAQNQSCTSNDAFDDFDFWLGDWNVFDTAGNQVGTNKIEKLEDGCLIMETWTGAGGSTGISLNYFNPVRNEWRQLWVSAGEYAIDYAGGLVDGAMVMNGELYNYGSGETFDFRGTWSENGDGSVRQFFEQYNNETESWDTWFDGRYVLQEMRE